VSINKKLKEKDFFFAVSAPLSYFGGKDAVY
jgi:hypothetical protein